MRRPTAGLVTIVVAVVVSSAASLVCAQADLVSQARRLDLDGKQDAAITLYRQALDRSPDSFDAHYGIARALDLVGNYEEARRHFARAIELGSEGAKDQALRMMGVSYAFTGQAAEASTYFKQAFDRSVAAGNFVAAAEVANELGRVYLELGRVDEGSKWYRIGYETAARQPNRPASDVDLAELRWAHAQGRVAARKGNAREAQRQSAIVRQLLDKGTNQDQRVQYQYLVGYVHFYLKEFKDAIASLQTADQSDPFILVLLAQAHERLGNTAQASEYYKKALASNSHAVSNAFARRLARERTSSSSRGAR